MGNKILSICIGCNKNGQYFSVTLQSIIKLLNKYGILNKSQVLICNDSENKSGDFIIAQQYKQKYPKLFKLIDNKKNYGIAYTYNLLLHRSKGQFFMAFDSDDIIADFNIIKEIQFLKNNDKYVGSYGLKKLFNNNGQQLCVTGGQCDLFNFGFYCNHNAMILKTQQAINAGGYYTYYLKKQMKVAPDIAMWIAMFIYKDLYFDNCLRCYGRIHDNNHSDKMGDLYETEFLQIQNSLIQFYCRNKHNCSDNLKIISQGLIRRQLLDQNYDKILFMQTFSQQILFSKYVFPFYIQFLAKKGYVAEIVSAILFGLLFNDELKQFVAKYCLQNRFISHQLRDFSKIKWLKNNFENVSLSDDDWFKFFFKK